MLASHGFFLAAESCPVCHVSAHLAAFRGRCMLSHVDSTSDSESRCACLHESCCESRGSSGWTRKAAVNTCGTGGG